MATLDSLKAFGADVDTGMARCMNNEGLYLRLVETVKDEENFSRLSDAIAANDLDTAFEAAHALKGVLGNLSITPLYDPMCAITELLRGREEADYASMVADIESTLAQFRAL